jgi:branched-chain amino acid transport system ATP-binding protein
VLIEHNFGFVTGLCQTAHVLHFGQRIASGAAATIAEDPKVVESYLGQSSGPRRAAVSDESSFEAAAAALLANEATAPAGGSTASSTIVELRDVVTGYGDLQVLRGVSLDLQRGKTEVVLGRNGVGKTTLLGTLSGQRRLWEGSVHVDGVDLTKAPAHRRAAAGIALVQEGKRIFRERTIFENVVLGTFTQQLSRTERQKLCDEVLEQFPVLAERRAETAGGLSGGQQQMLAIAQALASRPRVLLLDEPSAGLAPAIVAEVFERVAQLSANGMTVLLVEQLAEQALAIADHVTVIDSGKIVASGEPDQFDDLDALSDAYFGAS